jgi:uncharacterized membrane protein YeaQ/YmgE (transglycosylase-associated protein family)
VHILWTILIGFFAGIVAKLIMPGRDPGGFIITTVLGIVGAFVATLATRCFAMMPHVEQGHGDGHLCGHRRNAAAARADPYMQQRPALVVVLRRAAAVGVFRLQLGRIMGPWCKSPA